MCPLGGKFVIIYRGQGRTDPTLGGPPLFFFAFYQHENSMTHIAQCIFDFEIRKKQMFTEARAFSRVTYFLFSGEPAGFFLKHT